MAKNKITKEPIPLITLSYHIDGDSRNNIKPGDIECEIDDEIFEIYLEKFGTDKLFYKIALLHHIIFEEVEFLMDECVHTRQGLKDYKKNEWEKCLT